ncbi:tyrosyl-DNA phosphodiesterase-domain-containing protein [Schizophyllum amplum]|uniref:Tyrosyl-DNA phosphodiesterase-domain-containing protein n=1 Tax=Schizophyllum amplum TaxID=97359 RepID=A0A550CLZ3_9AGAR|nr:tyrosyl-DNA phosphodiesterase-domain-containing protein [Auriculariopsis ampla]
MDDDLERAIALSLQDSQARPRSPPIVIDDDDEDDDEPEDDETKFQNELQRAIEASKADSAERKADSNAASVSQTPHVSRTPEPPAAAMNDLQIAPAPGASGFLSERAKLEKERLERQRKRRREQGQQSEEEEEGNTSEPSAKRPRPTPPVQAPPAASSDVSRAVRSTSSSEEYFWEGAYRPIATKHAVPRKDGKPTFKLSQIIGDKSTLAFAILSSYALDAEWTYSFFDRDTPVIIVQQTKDGDATIRNWLPNWIRATPFLRNGYGCMHMKFMLLFYKTGRLRVYIPTANLVPYDYRDVENFAWLQDIPRRPANKPEPKKNPEDFPSMLQRVLEALNIKAALQAMIVQDHPNLALQSLADLRRLWDWSQVKVHLVASLAGKHEGWPAVLQTGHPRLMKVVRNMGLAVEARDGREVEVECQGSSIGRCTSVWINEMHLSMRGQSAQAWLDMSKKRREAVLLPPVKIVFPTRATVDATAWGVNGGGTIFCRRATWEAKNFPRSLFFDSRSTGGPVLMHTKMMLALIKDKKTIASSSRSKASGSKSTASKPGASSSKVKAGSRRVKAASSSSGSSTQDDSDSDPEIELVHPAIGWVYVGSHNFTQSAWGTLSGSGFNPVLNITNYELGVVFPIKDEAALRGVEVWERPPRRYGKEDDPWIQEECPLFQN